MYIDVVNELKAEDFKESDLYYELLDIENEVDRTLKCNEMRERSKALGLTGLFDSMWRSVKAEFYKAKKQKVTESKERGSHISDFSMRDASESQFNVGDWIANDEGIFIFTDSGVKYACRHPIYISRILRNAETGIYKVELMYMLRGKICTTYTDRETISNPSKIVKLANCGVQVTSISAPLLVQYLADLESLNPDIIRESISTGRLGWIDGVNARGEHERQFLPYQESIVFDNEMSIKSLYDSIREEGDYEKWLKCIKDVRARRDPEVLINMAAAFASVLVEPCGALPFIVSLWGGTGIGKTVILKICTSIWADPSEGKYITDAKATYTAMEMRLNVLNSLPMTLDDMAQIKNQYDGDFSELIYRWCAGKGRDRSNKELGLNKLTSWRNCTITNGERSLVDEMTQGGAVNRVIDIEASGKILFDGRLGNKVTKIIEANYGWAGREFIENLTQMSFEEINKAYSEWYERLKAEAKAQDMEKEEKQIVPMALILTADEMSEKWVFNDGVRIDINQCLGYLRNKGDVSEETRAYEYIIDMIAVNGYRFESDDMADDVRSDCWGYYREQNVVVINGTVFDKLLKDAGFQSKAFLSWAKKMNVIEPDARGNPKKVVSHNGAKYRAVILHTDYGEEPETVEIAEKVPFV